MLAQVIRTSYSGLIKHVAIKFQFSDYQSSTMSEMSLPLMRIAMQLFQAPCIVDPSNHLQYCRLLCNVAYGLSHI